MSRNNRTVCDEDCSKKSRRLSKSVRLKKYGVAYRKYISQNPESSNKPHSRMSRHKPRVSRETTESKNKTKKQLNSYQKFFKKESKSQKYSSMSAQDRMKAISEEWKLYKRKSDKNSRK